MTFRIYSKLTSSSCAVVVADTVGDPVLGVGLGSAGCAGAGVSTGWLSVLGEPQYPTPGFRCLSRSAAED
jgi:hypothetical protein